MASREAIECLRAGGKKWLIYINSAVKPIDLTSAYFAGEDLSGRPLYQCNLSGAQLKHAILDGSSFTECLLKGATLTNASLVRCEFSEVNASGVNIESAIMRESHFDKVILSGASMDAMKISNSQFSNCRLDDVSIGHALFTDVMVEESSIAPLASSGVRFWSCKFLECKLERWVISGTDIKDCCFQDCQIYDWQLKRGSIKSSEMLACKIRNFKSEKTDTEALTFNDSIVTDTHVAALGPSSAVMLNTAFISCDWPDQSGKVNWAGRYVRSQSLLAHPVQDIRGVPPQKRREIGDAQYLARMLDSAEGRMHRVLLRLWGATSAYGQSLKRLLLCSVLVVIGHTLAVLACRGQLTSSIMLDFKSLLHQLGSTWLAFLGLAESGPREASQWEKGVIHSARVFGLLIIGVWISIAANKYSRLSRE